MQVDLPERFYKERATSPQPLAPAARRLYMLLSVAIALFCFWQLAGLPGALVRKYDPPADMPWFEFGFAGVYIEADGTWTIHREGYADRMGRYVIDKDGRLGKSREYGMFKGDNLSGSVSAVGVQMSRTHFLSVHPSRSYFDWQRELRQKKSRPAPGPQMQDFQLPSYTGDSESAAESDVEAGLPFGPSIVIKTFTHNDKQQFEVLEGYHYFPVYDSGCMIDPGLWLTTDRLRYLHHLYASDESGKPVVRALQSAAINLGTKPDAESACGIDPISRELYIMLTDGRRFWFDPSTLAPLRQDQLPGCWQKEYGALLQARAGYSKQHGLPLSQAGYERVLRTIWVVFLVSLIWLVLLWRQTWKSTAAATIADTSSSAS